MSQGDLAKATGLLPSAIAHFEAARRMPTVHNLLRLADALDISLDVLFGRHAGRQTAKRTGTAVVRRRKQK